MTRIAIDYTSAIQQRAGIGRYTRHLVTALAALDHATNYVLFSAGRDPSPRAWPANFTRREVPISERYLSIIWQRLRLPLPVELFTGRVDVYHSPDFVLPPVIRARKVLTVHDLSFIRYPECSSPALLQYLIRSVPPSVRRADYLLADSLSTKQDLVELLGIPEERVTVVYAGYDPRFNPYPQGNDQEILAKYGIGGPYILALGTLQPRKNFSMLIRAYNHLVHEHNIPHILVIGGGKGWLYDDIFATVKELGLEKRVLFPGFVADENLPALYRGAELFAFPSLYEGFGIPILEAMGCGTPVVTSTSSSLPEVAGDAALCIDPQDSTALADAMWQALSDNTLRQTLQQRGLGRVKQFTWENAAIALLNVYRNAVT
ncbi:MAG: glycosyltransferase family 4 protein [Anaerolineae bacterium]